MKKLILVLTLGLVLGLTMSAQAALVTIHDTPNPVTEKHLYQIYNTLYSPATPLTSSSDLMDLENNTAIALGLFTSTAGHAYLVARYSAAPVTLSTYDSGGGSSLGSFSPGYAYYGHTLSYPVTNDEPFGFKAHVTYASLVYDWYSQKALNNPNDGAYHFVVMNTPYANKFFVGFEDMRTIPGSPYNSDWDYQDAVFELENIFPVPEPTSMMLLGMGILGLFGLRRKST